MSCLLFVQPRLNEQETRHTLWFYTYCPTVQPWLYEKRSRHVIKLIVGMFAVFSILIYNFAEDNKIKKINKKDRHL